MRLPESRRLELFEWCTGRTAVPTGGLKDKIRLKHYEVDDTNTLPECHTWCGASPDLEIEGARRMARTYSLTSALGPPA